MAQSAMAGSAPNAQAHGKANNNSAVKAQLQSGNNQNAAGNGNGAPSPRYSAPMDVASVAPSTTNAAVVANSNGTPGAANATSENAAATQSLQHDSGLALEWSTEEQSILEDALNK